MFSKLKYVILGAAVMAAFFYNPTKEDYYGRVLEDEAGIGTKVLSEVKYAVVEEAHTYQNYFVFGTLKSKRTEEVKYFGLFGQVFKK